MKCSTFLTVLIAAGAVGLGTASFAQPSGKTTTTDKPAATQPKDHKGDKADKGTKTDSTMGVKVGDMAPAFSLTDTDGKTVSLEQFKGKVVVLEWFNPECPFIVMHHKDAQTFNELYQQYNTKGVVFLAINSSAAGKEGAGKDLNAKKKTEYKMQYPILLDESGATGHAYGATNTPHCFVIGTDGKIAYAGAIDNYQQDKKHDKNYGKMALDNVLAGKAADPASTKPYGCGVKYGK